MYPLSLVHWLEGNSLSTDKRQQQVEHCTALYFASPECVGSNYAKRSLLKSLNYCLFSLMDVIVSVINFQLHKHQKICYVMRWELFVRDSCCLLHGQKCWHNLFKPDKQRHDRLFSTQSFLTVWQQTRPWTNQSCIYSSIINVRCEAKFSRLFRDKDKWIMYLLSFETNHW